MRKKTSTPGANPLATGRAHASMEVGHGPFPTEKAASRDDQFGQTDRLHRRAEVVVDDDFPLSTGVADGQLVELPPLSQEALVRLVLLGGRMARRQGRALPASLAMRLAESSARGETIAPVLEKWAVRIGVLNNRFDEAKDRAKRGKRISRAALLAARQRLLAIGTAAGAGQQPRVTREDLDWADQFSKRSTPVVVVNAGDVEVDPEQRRRNAAAAPRGTVTRVSEDEGLVMPQPAPKQRAIEIKNAPPLLFDELEPVIDHTDPENWT